MKASLARSQSVSSSSSRRVSDPKTFRKLCNISIVNRPFQFLYFKMSFRSAIGWKSPPYPNYGQCRTFWVLTYPLSGSADRPSLQFLSLSLSSPLLFAWNHCSRTRERISPLSHCVESTLKLQWFWYSVWSWLKGSIILGRVTERRQRTVEIKTLPTRKTFRQLFDGR